MDFEVILMHGGHCKGDCILNIGCTSWVQNWIEKLMSVKMENTNFAELSPDVEKSFGYKNEEQKNQTEKINWGYFIEWDTPQPASNQIENKGHTGEIN